MSVNEDSPLRWAEQPADELDEGGFARSVHADYRDIFARTNGEAEIVQGRVLRRRIGVRDIFKYNGRRGFRYGDSRLSVEV